MDKLKIGLLLDQFAIPKWQYSVIGAIRRLGYAEISFVLPARENEPISTSAFSGLEPARGNYLYRFHLKSDRVIFGRHADYSLTMDSKTLLKNIRIVHGFTDNPEELKPDVILNFSSARIPAALYKESTYGIWQIRHGDHKIHPDGPPAYWDCIEQWEETGFVLEMKKDAAGQALILQRSQLPSIKKSITLNRHYNYWRSSLFIPRVLEGIHKGGQSYLDQLIKKNQTSLQKEYTTPLHYPSTAKALKNLFRHGTNLTKRVVEKSVYIDQWFLLIREGKVNDLNFSPENFRTLYPPKDRFWADPFIVTRDNRHYIFVEELLYKTNLGHISVLELDLKGNFISNRKILEKPYHLSYPFVFEHEGIYYMIPETSANHTIDLYKCTGFPYQWEFVITLMEGVHAVDSTLLHHGNRWWLFCSIDETGGKSYIGDELHIFYADHFITKEWKPHDCNPVISEVKFARPAGRFFRLNDKIYRPSQDSSGDYGTAININEVIILTEKVYQEKPVSRINAGWDPMVTRTHTLNFNDQLTVLDSLGKRRRFI